MIPFVDTPRYVTWRVFVGIGCADSFYRILTLAVTVAIKKRILM